MTDIPVPTICLLLTFTDFVAYINALDQAKCLLRMTDQEKQTLNSKKKAVKTPTSWQRVWFDFTQSTTLHGVNKITEDTPFNIRREGSVILCIQ